MKLKKALNLIGVMVSIIIIFIPQSSCKKTIITNTVTDTIKHAWQQITTFNTYGSAELTSTSIGDSALLVATSSVYVTMPVKGVDSFRNFTGRYLYGTTLYSPANVTPYVNSNLCAYSTPTSLYVMSVPIYSQYSSFSYTPIFTTGSYSVIPQTGLYPSVANPASAYPVIKNKYLLMPVESYPNDPAQKNRFDLLSFDSTQILSRFGLGGTPIVKSILLTPASGTIGFSLSGYFCATYFNKFFVFFGSQFFRIDTAGNIKKFGYLPAPYSKGYGVYNMFTFGNTLFVNSGGVLFASTDQGENWGVFNDFSGTNVGAVIFRNVGTKLYASAPTLSSQLFKITFTGNNLNFSELNNDGLDGCLITSITQCGKFDFLTTTAGVFYRDTTYFDQLKYPIR